MNSLQARERLVRSTSSALIPLPSNATAHRHSGRHTRSHPSPKQCLWCEHADAVVDVPSGNLKLDELVTRRYRLDQINDAITDMREGRNIRGIIEFD